MSAQEKPRHVRLVIADVDGTLVTQEKVLTKRAMDAVAKLRDAGILFAITSGRPPKGMAMLTQPLELSEPVAAFNGGVVTQPDLTTVVREQFLAPEAVARARELILEHKHDAWVYTDQTWYVRDVKAAHVAREQWTVKFAPVVTEHLDVLTERVAKVVGVSDDLAAVERCEKDVRQALGNSVSAARSQPYYLDVTNPKANKGEVVLAMSELLQVPTEEIATIGDMPNDVLMFVKSGVSIAMGNASDDVKKQATYTTASNEEEGFAIAMERFILKGNAAAS